MTFSVSWGAGTWARGKNREMVVGGEKTKGKTTIKTNHLCTHVTVSSFDPTDGWLG
jgi:hypothetical protein